MKKTHVKRSTFERITLTMGVTLTKILEADEVHFQVVTPNSYILVAGSKELEYVKFTVASNWNPTPNAPAGEIFVTTSLGRRQWGAGYDSTNTHLQLITDANVAQVGIKETATFRIHPSSPNTNNVDVIIEYVNYIPADMIAA